MKTTTIQISPILRGLFAVMFVASALLGAGAWAQTAPEDETAPEEQAETGERVAPDSDEAEPDADPDIGRQFSPPPGAENTYQFAVANQLTALASVLLEKKSVDIPFDGQPSLVHWAALGHRNMDVPAFIGALIADNANIHFVDTKNGNTPLLHAASFGNVGALKMLIDHGADLNAKNNGGNTALMIGANTGNTDIVRELIDANAGLDEVSRFSDTALMLAAAEGHLDIVRNLVDAGADCFLRDKSGKTAFLRARERGQDSTWQYLGLKNLQTCQYLGLAFDLERDECVECMEPRFKNFEGLCVQCGEEEVRFNNRCVKLDECRPDQVRAPDGISCGCPTGLEDTGSACAEPCRSDQERAGDGSCQCPIGHREENGACVHSCPADRVPAPDGISCQCQEGYYDNGSGCVRSPRCERGHVLNERGSECFCPPHKYRYRLYCSREYGCYDRPHPNNGYVCVVPQSE